MPACGSWPAAVPLAAYSGGVVRSATGDFTSSPTDDPGAPAAWLPANRTYLLALFNCLSLPAHKNAPYPMRFCERGDPFTLFIFSRMLHSEDTQREYQ